MSIQCPRCKLISPLETEKCDCGYDLHLPATMQATASRQPFHRYSFAQVLGGALIGAVELVWGRALYNYVLLIGFSSLSVWAVLWVTPFSALALTVGLMLIATGRSRW